MVTVVPGTKKTEMLSADVSWSSADPALHIQLLNLILFIVLKLL